MEETKTKKQVPSWLKLAGIALPVLITGLFNYFSAKLEADKANQRAAMSYEALVGTVTKLQDAVEKLSEAQADLKVAQAELKGRVEAGEKYSSKLSGMQTTVPRPSPVQLDRLPMSLEALSQSKK